MTIDRESRGGLENTLSKSERIKRFLALSPDPFPKKSYEDVALHIKTTLQKLAKYRLNEDSPGMEGFNSDKADIYLRELVYSLRVKGKTYPAAKKLYKVYKKHR